MRLPVVHRLLEADLDAVDRVHHVLEAAEVDDHVVVDPDPAELLHRTNGAGGAADLERLVELRESGLGAGAVLLEAVRDVRHQVARQRDGGRGLPVRRQVQQDRGVRALAAAVVAAVSAVAARARVRADEQQVLRVVRAGRGALLLVALQLGGGRGVGADVVVELLVEPPAGAAWRRARGTTRRGRSNAASGDGRWARRACRTRLRRARPRRPRSTRLRSARLPSTRLRSARPPSARLRSDLLPPDRLPLSRLPLARPVPAVSACPVVARPRPGGRARGRAVGHVGVHPSRVGGGRKAAGAPR